MVGDWGRGVMSVEGRTVGTASTMVGDSGSTGSCFSCIDSTIFSNRKGDMRVSFPRLVANEGTS